LSIHLIPGVFEVDFGSLRYLPECGEPVTCVALTTDIHHVIPDFHIELPILIDKPSLITDMSGIRYFVSCTRVDGLGGRFKQNIGVYVCPEIDWHRELIEIELLRRM